MTGIKTTAMLGALAVIVGAFGAHSLSGAVSPERLDVFKTGVFYHIIHTLVLLVLNLQTRYSYRWAKRCLFIGILIFSGSLYTLVLTDTSWIGAITPIGGLTLISGWLFIAKESQ